jgi:hypothetical protein
MLRAIFAIFALTIGCCISVAAAPTAAACPAGSYKASSGDCVEDPDSSPSNVTAICADGTDSHSEHHSGTCSGHGGVSQWCPCAGTAAPASASPPDSDSRAPDPDTYLFALHQDGFTLTQGDNAAIAGGLSICQEARRGKGANAVSLEVMNAPGNDVNFAEAADMVAESLLELCPDVDANVWHDAMQLAERNPDNS